MSREANKSIEEKLPDHYPRSEEILIFSDMGELDHVFGLLDDFKEDVYSITLDTSEDEWSKLIDYSVIYTLIRALRKACFEFERFWVNDDNWKPEDDIWFMNCMNDPDELQWLVTDLDSRRMRVVEKIINGRIYDPAYWSAARSLQIAMSAYKYPGDKDWIDYCVNQLKQTLTRYHAASLEIVAHRNNVYLNTEVMPDAEVGRKRREQSSEWSAWGRRLRGSNVDKYTEQHEEKWINTATELQLRNPALKSARGLALKVISELKMPKSSYESVRKCLAQNGFKQKMGKRPPMPKF